MMIMTALELLWFLSGTGPLFTRVANFVTNKCTKNWWLNFLFINNYFIDSIDICGGSSFYTSVDLQLFILGLIVIYVFTLSPKAGYTLSCLCIITSWVYTAINVIKNESTGILFRANPIPIKISEYFDHVHMATPTYIPGDLIHLIFVTFLQFYLSLRLPHRIVYWLRIHYRFNQHKSNRKETSFHLDRR